MNIKALEHTPGPWRRTNLTIHMADAGLAIARVLEAGIETEAASSVFQATANARLIAAAPDLLETAQYFDYAASGIVIEPSDDGDDVVEIGITVKALRDLRALLARINGSEDDTRNTPSEPPSIKRLIDRREADVRSGRLAWAKAAIGCYWSRGDYAIACVHGGDAPAGYLLMYRRTLIGDRFPTIEAAEQAAREHEGR